MIRRSAGYAPSFPLWLRQSVRACLGLAGGVAAAARAVRDAARAGYSSVLRLLAAAQAGEDIDERSGVGEWEASTQPMEPSEHPEGTVLVGRSLRMSMDTYQRIRAAATARGTTWSALVREWIDQVLAAAESGSAPDPIAELHRSIDAATRALRALERHPAA